jgi:hypothetical protein
MFIRQLIPVFFIAMFMLPGSLLGQQSNTLYSISPSKLSEWPSEKPGDMEASLVSLNRDIIQSINSGQMDLIDLAGPDGFQFTADIKRILRHPNGSWSSIGHIGGDSFNAFTMSYSAESGRILSSMNILSDHKFFELRYDPQLSSHIIVEKDPHKSDKLDCGYHDGLSVDSSTLPNLQRKVAPQRNSGPSTIDVLIVYTNSARSWAELRGGIDNIINQSMATANLAALNSEMDITFRLVHSQEVDYRESGDSEVDLKRLTCSLNFNPSSLCDVTNIQEMDEVHILRDQYKADLVALFTFTDDVGGIAWRIGDPNGTPQLGYSITRVRSASGTTHAHEMGHNFGNSHSRNQNSAEAGPSGGVFPYSTGWRWTGNDGNSYSSVMTYTESSTETTHFSNPNVLFQGVPTGSYSGEFAPADNARSMREMQYAIESYRIAPTGENLATVETGEVQDVSYAFARPVGTITDNGGSEITGRGFCYSTEPEPDFSDICQSVGSGTGTFETLLTNLQQGTTYYIRAFASNFGGTAFGNEQSFTTLSIDTPENVIVTNQTAVSFTASWDPVPDASRYFIDVSTQPTFNSFFTGYQSRDVGSSTIFKVDGLQPGLIYYFRVRAGKETAQSENSEVLETSTIDISANNSDVIISREKVLATGIQQSEIEVVVENSRGETLEGVRVVVEPDGGNSIITPESVLTNQEGTARFQISNSNEETVEYSIKASGLELVRPVEIEFVFSEGQLTLGNNYPNPYNNQTLIPFVVPESGPVRLDIYNTSGVLIRTLVNETFPTGYYEVPFNGAGLASGVYFYRLITDQGVLIEKMLLAK